MKLERDATVRFSRNPNQIPLSWPERVEEAITDVIRQQPSPGEARRVALHFMTDEIAVGAPRLIDSTTTGHSQRRTRRVYAS
jgi:hypothetical protein